MLHLILTFFQETTIATGSTSAPETPSFLIEGILVLLIILIQGRLFLKTRSRIFSFEKALPDVNQFSIARVVVYTDELRQTAPLEVLRNISKLELDEDSDLSKPNTEITLLQSTEASEPLERIKESINTYLIRNKGAVADFNLLRDITQRNLDTLEEEITILLPLPLYVGLLGTMMGIVIGLFNMPTLAITQFSSEGSSNLSGVNVLIDGVKYAMLASFAGLLATVINSWRYRGAKLILEHNKHDFFTFLQTELLPILTESVNVGIYDLNRSLSQFGIRFTDVANQLDKTVARNYDALMAQQELLTKIQSMDLSRVANFNIRVMDELRRSTSSLERFGTFLGTLTSLTDNARELVQRTSNVEAISSQLTQLLTESQRLQRFLMSHFEQLEERGQVINTAVVKLDGVVDKSLDELQRHIVERVDSVRKITIHEDDLLLQTYERNRDAFKNLRHLGPLEKGVEGLSKQAEQFQQKNQATFGAILWTLEQINQQLVKQNETRREGLGGQFLRWLNSRPGSGSQTDTTDESIAQTRPVSKRESRKRSIPVFDEPLGAAHVPHSEVVSQKEISNFSVHSKIYFSNPHPEGWFDDSERLVQPTPDTCYRFTLTTKTAGVATFAVEADPDHMPRILNLRDQFLNPVCESQNSYQSAHSRVITLREGKARLSNGQWQIEIKAQTQYT